MFFYSKKAQALIEYIFILAFIGFVAVGMMKGFGQAFSNSMGSLNYYLTQELSIGVCNRSCLGNHHNNFLKR